MGIINATGGIVTLPVPSPDKRRGMMVVGTS